MVPLLLRTIGEASGAAPDAFISIAASSHALVALLVQLQVTVPAEARVVLLDAPVMVVDDTLIFHS